MQFKITRKETQPNPNLKDIKDYKIDYITLEELNQQYKIPKQVISHILFEKNICPIVKILNRNKEGKSTGGRPKLGFDPIKACAAINIGIEEKYGKE